MRNPGVYDLPVMGDERGILFISPGAGTKLLHDFFFGGLGGYDLTSAYIAGISRFDMGAKE